MTIRVALIDDHPIVIDGLRAALARSPDIVIAWQASTLLEARRLLATRRADVALLDLRLADGSGADLLAESHDAPDPPGFVVLSTFATPRHVTAAITLGALGFVLKTAPTDEIVAAIRTAAAGRLAFTGEQLRAARSAPWLPLTPREHEIIAGVMAGWSNDELSSRLHLARKTVEAYLSRLFVRYRVVTRTELGILAEREQLLSLPVDPRRIGTQASGRVSPASRAAARAPD